MKTCDTCKHWASEPVSTFPSSNEHECLCPKIDNDGRFAPDGDDCLRQFGNDAGWIMNATGPKFGCIHWEAK